MSAPAMWIATYMRAVRCAAGNPHLPFTHILLSPLVPYIKYAVPFFLSWSACKVFSLDSMFVRMLAEREAEAILNAKRRSNSDQDKKNS
jgi:hypothetical protein